MIKKRFSAPKEHLTLKNPMVSCYGRGGMNKKWFPSCPWWCLVTSEKWSVTATLSIPSFSSQLQNHIPNPAFAGCLLSSIRDSKCIHPAMLTAFSVRSHGCKDVQTVRKPSSGSRTGGSRQVYVHTWLFLLPVGTQPARIGGWPGSMVKSKRKDQRRRDIEVLSCISFATNEVEPLFQCLLVTRITCFWSVSSNLWSTFSIGRSVFSCCFVHILCIFQRWRTGPPFDIPSGQRENHCNAFGRDHLCVLCWGRVGIWYDFKVMDEEGSQADVWLVSNCMAMLILKILKSFCASWKVGAALSP